VLISEPAALVHLIMLPLHALKNLTASETGGALSCCLATALKCVRDCSVHPGFEG
jgi:hypothetical protein